MLDLQDGKYYGLDAVGAHIWNLIQQPISILTVRDLLLEDYDVDAERCLAEVLALLQRLADHNLVDVYSKVTV